MRFKTVYTVIVLLLTGFFFGHCQERPSFEISFDGPEWHEKFIEQYDAELFNAPYTLENEKPHYLWRETGIKNGSLLFDGYSTYLEIKDFEFGEEFAISFWIAPRAFDAAVDNKISAVIDQSNYQKKTGFKVGIYKHGELVLQYGNGEKYFTLSNDKFLLKKNEWNFVVISKSKDKLKLFLNDEKVAEVNLLVGKNSFLLSDGSILIGRNQNASGFGEKFKFNMISGLLDEIYFYSTPLNEQEVEYLYQDVAGEGEISNIPLSDIRLDFTKYSEAEFRPNYHAIAPAHWMNEPHAPFYYNGKYHLFYQHNPFGPYWGQIHWGHWVSDDMVNWEHAKIALAPERGDLDPDGIWSGSAFIGPDGIPLLYYTAGNWSKEQNQYVSIAVPENIDDPNLESWKKTGIIIDKPEEYLKNEFRDPFVFQIDEKYYMIVGSGIENKGGSAPLFESDDAKNWNYLHPFFLSDIQKYPYLGGVWELPVFLPIQKENSDEGEQKYIFMVLPIRNEANVEVFYWIGEFDEKELKFVPDDPEPKLIDYGDFGFTGPSGFVDPKTNRTIVFTIAQGKYGKLDTYDMGWAHNAGLPVELSLDENNELIVKPIKELQKLRSERIISCSDCDLAAVNGMLKSKGGDQLEILIEFGNTKDLHGIEVRKTKNDSIKAMIYYDPASKSVVFDKKQPFPLEDDFTKLSAPVDLENKNLKLHIFLDKSMIEIYINDRKSITNRIYFKEDGAKDLKLLGTENLNIENIQIWKMNGIDWKYVE